MTFYTVGQLTKLHGVSPSTIRRWEASGLVAPPFPMHLLRIQGECGRSSLPWGEPEKHARAQVNLGRHSKPTLNQQQESTEEIGGASC